jgi:hypothetical protein
MRSGTVDAQTLQLLGAALELPAPGVCTAATAASFDSPAGDASTVPLDLRSHAVELLDVGAVSIDAQGVHTELEARALPDIVDLVTGVVYSTHVSAPDAAGLPSRGDYVVRATGSTRANAEHTVPSFSVRATSPGQPEDLTIDGQDARSKDGVVLVAGSQAKLTWSTSGASDPDDLVYVDVISSDEALDDGSGARGAYVRCLLTDTGAATIPSSAFVLPRTSDLTTGATEMMRGTLAVHRVHRETFQTATPGDAAGRPPVESGVVRFDFARAAEFTRR